MIYHDNSIPLLNYLYQNHFIVWAVITIKLNKDFNPSHYPKYLVVKHMREMLDPESVTIQ